jgi:ankyrin repeat protein
VSEPLLAAIRAGDLGETRRLLDTGADPRFALHAAAERGPLALLELLIGRGAIFWHPDGDGRTPLDAARAGSAADRDAIVELLDRPVIRDPAFRAAVNAIHAGDIAALETATPEELQTALALAVINDRADTARVALDAGADVNAFLPRHGHSTALHQATLHDDVELLELLVQRGARTDVRDTVWNGTARDWALHERQPRAAAYLETVGG